MSYKIHKMEFIFYKISCLDDSVIGFYIGSTKNFTKRKYHHKNACHNENNNNYKCKIYETIRENGGWINWEMNPIDKQIFSNKLDARIYERKLTDELKATLNAIRAFSSAAEKVEKNKQSCNKWRIENRDKWNQYRREWRATKKAQQSESKSESES